MNRACTIGRGLDQTAVTGLPDPEPEWGELHEDKKQKGDRRRDQHDEERPFENDFNHTSTIRCGAGGCFLGLSLLPSVPG